MSVETIIGLIVAGVLSVLGYLLKRRDDDTAKDIAALRQELKAAIDENKASIRILFQKHDQDAARLEELRYQIAGGHYTKVELNQILDRLEKNLTDLFTATNAGVREVMVQVQAIAAKVDTLQTAVTQHVAKEEKGR